MISTTYSNQRRAEDSLRAHADHMVAKVGIMGFPETCARFLQCLTACRCAPTIGLARAALTSSRRSNSSSCLSTPSLHTLTVTNLLRQVHSLYETVVQVTGTVLENLHVSLHVDWSPSSTQWPGNHTVACRWEAQPTQYKSADWADMKVRKPSAEPEGWGSSTLSSLVYSACTSKNM